MKNLLQNFFQKMFDLKVFIMICVSTVLANHIIFEQVGEMASSVTYIHVKMEVDIQAVEEHIKEYQLQFPKLDELFKTKLQTHLDSIKYWTGYDYGEPVDAAKSHYRELKQVLESRQKHTETFLEALKALRGALPNQDSNLKGTYYRTKRQAQTTQRPSRTKTIIKGLAQTAARNIDVGRVSKTIKGLTLRQPRSLLGLGLGTLGTFMGLFNTFQIEGLKRDMDAQKEAHNRLVEVVEEQGAHIEQLNSTVEVLISKFEFHRFSNAAILNNRFRDIEEEIWQRINRITHVLQVAQTHRLALDFLPSDYLPILFEQLKVQAGEINHKLIIQKPSDLYQLELSYFFDGVNVQLLLHVPSVPNDSILRLLKLHPFPLPLNKNYSVIPMVQDDLLAISSGFTRYSAQLSTVDLLGCHAVNSVYFCERHGVLSKQLNNSCLGSLYLQDFETAQLLCPLHVRPTGEVVKQLLDNWFLIFSPHPQTAYITCRNGTNTEAYIKGGITRSYLSPGCRMSLTAHLLHADFSLRLPDEIVTFQWDWDTNLSENLDNDMETLKEAGITEPTLKDLKLLRRNRYGTILFKILVIFIISVIALGLITLAIGWYFARDLVLKIPCINKCLSPQVRDLLNSSESQYERIRVPRHVCHGCRPVPMSEIISPQES
jgi:hypothetical protein